MDTTQSYRDNRPVEGTYDPKWVAYYWAIHLFGICGAVYGIFYASAAIVWSAVAYYFLCHFSITVFAHRCLTHMGFRMARPLEYIFALLFSGTSQGTLYWWTGTHRKHHAYEDIEGDPHSPRNGFIHAHCGWLMKKNGLSTPDRKYIRHFSQKPDRYKVVLWQRKNYLWLALLMTYGVPLCIGLFFGDPLGGLFVIGFARLLFQYHGTWAVNSLGHTVGDRLDGLATNFGIVAFWGVKAFRLVSAFTIMPILAIVTVGEVWHANHHISARDWRLGRKWWQIDPGKYLILLLSKIGLVSELADANERSFTPSDRPQGGST